MFNWKVVGTLLFIGSLSAWSAATKYIDADGIKNPAHTKTWTMPASSGTLARTADNVATATALAANPAPCPSYSFVSDTAANGDLTCTTIPNLATTATSANTVSTIVARDGSGDFSAGTITAALSGNASTATTAAALTANPADCGANTFATTIAANGDLTCAGVAPDALTSPIPISLGGTGATAKSAAFDALQPMISPGDIIVGGASGTGTRLAKGSETDVLAIVSGAPAWKSGGAGSVTSVGLSMPAEFAVSGSPVTTTGTLAVSRIVQPNGTFLAGPVNPSPSAAPTFRAITVQDLPYNLVSKATNYTATNADETIVFTADATLTLPTAVGITGKKYHVVASGSGVDVTIDPNGSETVCGKTTIFVGRDGDEVTIQSNGTNWIGLENSCFRTEYVIFGGGASGGAPTSACTSSPCTIASQSSEISSSVTRASTGIYNVTYLTGAFSTIPSCTCSQGWFGIVTGGICSAYGETTTTGHAGSWLNNGAGVVDSVISIVCKGPR